VKESTAILLGSVIISIAVLISGGVIKTGTLNLNKNAATTAGTTPTASTATAAQPVADANKVKDAFNKAQLKFGDTNSKLVVVEVADPSCPYCSIAAGHNPELNKQVGERFTLVSDGGKYVAPVPEIEKLVKENKASFAYIYYPGHGSGEMGAKALYCANETDNFWAVHDLIMSGAGYDLLNNQVKNDKTKSGLLADFLQSVINSNTLKSCLDSGKYDSRLKEDAALATGLGVQGTPGFFLNDKQFDGAYSFTDMEETIKAALGS
jgi:protein-disulfide isomerase